MKIDPASASPPSPPQAGELPAALRAVAAVWMRRGFRMRYHDPYLVQLVRRESCLNRRSLPYLLLALPAVAIGLAALATALRRRPWQVVTLVQGPNGRILTHRQRALHPPAP